MSIAIGALVLASCAPRAQMILYIDTDAPVVGQLTGRPDLSPDAAMDVLRIDALRGDGHVFDVCEYSVSDPADWPLSIGVARPDGADAITLRLRLFRRAFAVGSDLSGIQRRCGQEVGSDEVASVHEPEDGLAIDRVISLRPPDDDITRVQVRLSLDCLGVPASFLAPQRTCLDAKNLHAPVEAGMTPVADPAAVTPSVGTAASALTTACAVPGRQDTACIPGGLSILGDRRFVGFGSPRLQSTPLRAVRLSPFYMDLTEFTVARMRAVVAHLPEAPRGPQDPDVYIGHFCTWQDGADGRLPVNCISVEAARAACQRVGGDLPSEAQWEYAARGRDQHRTYPWGEAEAACCTASLERWSMERVPVHCPGKGPEPVGSHGGANCPGGGDVSRDGIFDLGGSMTEYLRDGVSAYRERCGLGEGLTLDPACPSTMGANQLARGSDWSAGNNTSFVAWRRLASLNVVTGFRCVYPGSP